MKRYDKLIFAGTDNTAVSVMAEAILQNMFRLEDILIESRGLVVLFPEPVNPKAETVLVSGGLSMKDHASSALTANDFDERTLILTMNGAQKEKILNEFENTYNVYTLSEYISSEEEPENPYGGSVSDYGRCFEQLKRMVGELGDKLKEEDR